MSAMTIGQVLPIEQLHGSVDTPKMVEHVPEERSDWKPYEKSMTLRPPGRG